MVCLYYWSGGGKIQKSNFKQYLGYVSGYDRLGDIQNRRYWHIDSLFKMYVWDIPGRLGKISDCLLC